MTFGFVLRSNTNIYTEFSVCWIHELDSIVLEEAAFNFVNYSQGLEWKISPLEYVGITLERVQLGILGTVRSSSSRIKWTGSRLVMVVPMCKHETQAPSLPKRVFFLADSVHIQSFGRTSIFISHFYRVQNERKFKLEMF